MRNCNRILAASLVLSSFLPAQNNVSTSSAASVPNDPLQFIEAAAKANGLAADNIGPWHAQADFQLLDGDGNVREAGRFEAFWISANRYRMSYTSPSYNRTLWATDAGSFATSDPKWPGDVEWMVRRSLFDIAPEHGGNPDKFNLQWRGVSAGIQVRCVDWQPKIETSPSSWRFPSFCFETNSAAIRYSSTAMQVDQGIYNEIIDLNGAYVPRDVILMHAGEKYFHLHVSELEPLVEKDNKLFVPDQGAVRVSRRTLVLLDTNLRNVRIKHMEGIARPSRDDLTTMHMDSIGGSDLHNLTLRHPGLIAHPPVHAAKAQLTANQVVVVQILVNKKGEVVSARGVAGDPKMRLQGETAAKKWTFEPYRVQGEPTEFYTELKFF